jgi:hypothetical protein
MITNEDLSRILKPVVEELKRIIDDESLKINHEQKRDLTLLYEYYLRNLITIENSIGSASKEDETMVNKLKDALEIIHQDNKITEKEIETFVKIAKDLKITEQELEDLKKAGH